jgi:hypothetical protein
VVLRDVVKQALGLRPDSAAKSRVSLNLEDR